MERLWQCLVAVPRAAVAPMVIGVVALAVVALLGPAIYLPSREPFNRLMLFLELLLGRPAPAPREPPAG